MPTIEAEPIVDVPTVDEHDRCHIVLWGSLKAACGRAEQCEYEMGEPERVDACPGCGRLICEDCQRIVANLVHAIEHGA